jgi:phosphatidate cytidylyltransferase
LVVAAVLLLSTPWVALVFALVVVLGAWEWTRLAGVDGTWRWGYLALIAAALAVLWWLPALIPWVLGAAVLWWGLLAVLLFRVRAVAPVESPDPALLALGVLVLAAPWAALIHLHGRGIGAAEGPLLVLGLLVLIWIADTAAYFSGRRWGRAKLAPVLSPGKTHAGLYGGLIGACLFGAVAAWAAGLGWGAGLLLVGVCAMTAFVSVVGDLFESLLKRRRALKDSGRLLPGHGGILDRIDSLTAAAPLFALGVLWLGGRL